MNLNFCIYNSGTSSYEYGRMQNCPQERNFFITVWSSVFLFPYFVFLSGISLAVLVLKLLVMFD